MIDFVKDDYVHARACLHARTHAIKDLVCRPSSEGDDFVPFIGQFIPNLSENSVFCVDVSTINFHGSNLTPFGRTFGFEITADESGHRGFP